MRQKLFTLLLLLATALSAQQTKTLYELQQHFVDLRFGMFIHYNIPTYAPEDWPDPDLSPSVFNPQHLDCRQWARAAKSAGMTYGCLTTKHHSGFCIWDTKTTDYNVMQSPLKRDVVREYVDAFRAEGLEVMLYYSILDTHHRLRPGLITRKKVDMIKAQLHELLTQYGEITALIIDGWDAPWSRISYEEVPFPEIYQYIKSLQPNCLVMDLNAAKYPTEALFYTDIKSYEQGAGQHISTSTNRLPALACLPLQRTWFWKESMPTDEMKDATFLVKENVEPYGKAHCNFILNVAPNRDGLMDENALASLREIGEMWNERNHYPLRPAEAPIVQRNIAKHCPTESSWSYDYGIMDFANDDDFVKGWTSHPLVQQPWWMVDLKGKHIIDMVTITEERGGNMQAYRVECRNGKEWTTVYEDSIPDNTRVRIHRFSARYADAVRITVLRHKGKLCLGEVGVYEAPKGTKVAKAKNDNVVVAYVTSWSKVMPNPNVMTHINYAFCHVTDSFDGVRIDNPDRLRQIVALKKQNPALKVMLSVGGWGSGRFSEMVATDATRMAFCLDCKRVVKEFGLDGIDIDWEYPTSKAAGISSSPNDTKNFTLLMRDLRKVLGKKKYVTLATVASGQYIDFRGIEPYIDFVNMMTYDMGNAPMHHSALYPSEHTGWMTASQGTEAHLRAGVPAHKLVMGVPFYGRAIKDYGGFTDYKRIAPTDKYRQAWDTEAQAPYMENAQGELVCGFDTPQSLRLKCRFVRDRGMRGMMYWDYSGDNEQGDLQKTLWEEMNR